MLISAAQNCESKDCESSGVSRKYFWKGNDALFQQIILLPSSRTYLYEYTGYVEIKDLGK